MLPGVVTYVSPSGVRQITVPTANFLGYRWEIFSRL